MPKTLPSPIVNMPFALSTTAALVPEPHTSPLRAAEQEMSALLSTLAESLTKSCVYFAPENTQALVPPPPIPPILEDLDGRMRGLLGHTEVLAAYEKRKSLLPETIGDLFAAAGAVHHAYELFRLLRIVRLPPFGFAPLVRMTDQVVILLQATAYALDKDDPSAARAAMRATLQVRSICHEMSGIIADLATFLPQRSWKMMKAASDCLMVATEAVTRVAQRTAGEPIALPMTVTTAPNRPAPRRPESALQAMPTKKRSSPGGITAWLRAMFGKR